MHSLSPKKTRYGGDQNILQCTTIRIASTTFSSEVVLAERDVLVLAGEVLVLVLLLGPHPDAGVGALLVGLAGCPEPLIAADKASPAPAVRARGLQLTGPQPDAWPVEPVRAQLVDEEVVLPSGADLGQEGTPTDARAVAGGRRGPGQPGRARVEVVAGAHVLAALPTVLARFKGEQKKSDWLMSLCLMSPRMQISPTVIRTCPVGHRGTPDGHRRDRQQGN